MVDDVIRFVSEKGAAAGHSNAEPNTHTVSMDKEKQQQDNGITINQVF